MECFLKDIENNSLNSLETVFQKATLPTTLWLSCKYFFLLFWGFRIRGRSHLAQEVYLSFSTLFQDVQTLGLSGLDVCSSQAVHTGLYSKVLFLWSRLPEPWTKLTSPWLCAWTAAAHCPAGVLHQHQQWGGVHSRDQRAMCKYRLGCAFECIRPMLNWGILSGHGAELRDSSPIQ